MERTNLNLKMPEFEPWNREFRKGDKVIFSDYSEDEYEILEVKEVAILIKKFWVPKSTIVLLKQIGEIKYINIPEWMFKVLDKE